MSKNDELKLRSGEVKNIAFKELSIVRNLIFWVDVINNGNNQNHVIFVRPFNKKAAIPQQLTSDVFHIKSNFHGYGGKSYQCIDFKNKFYLLWIDQLTKAIWLQIFESIETVNSFEKQYP